MKFTINWMGMVLTYIFLGGKLGVATSTSNSSPLGPSQRQALVIPRRWTSDKSKNVQTPAQSAWRIWIAFLCQIQRECYTTSGAKSRDDLRVFLRKTQRTSFIKTGAKRQGFYCLCVQKTQGILYNHRRKALYNFIAFCQHWCFYVPKSM